MGTRAFNYFGGVAQVAVPDNLKASALNWIWLIPAFWIDLRALFGMIRIWPGSRKIP
jgi:hypothetical protein